MPIVPVVTVQYHQVVETLPSRSSLASVSVLPSEPSTQVILRNVTHHTTLSTLSTQDHDTTTGLQSNLRELGDWISVAELRLQVRTCDSYRCVSGLLTGLRSGRAGGVCS